MWPSRGRRCDGQTTVGVVGKGHAVVIAVLVRGQFAIGTKVTFETLIVTQSKGAIGIFKQLVKIHCWSFVTTTT